MTRMHIAECESNPAIRVIDHWSMTKFPRRGQLSFLIACHWPLVNDTTAYSWVLIKLSTFMSLTTSGQWHKCRLLSFNHTSIFVSVNDTDAFGQLHKCMHKCHWSVVNDTNECHWPQSMTRRHAQVSLTMVNYTNACICVIDHWSMT